MNKELKTAFAAIGGEVWDPTNCRCELEVRVGATPCQYCAIHQALLFATTQATKVEKFEEAINMKKIRIVLDGPPGPHKTSGRFVEIEDQDGRGVCVGQWEKEDKDSDLWVLEIPCELTRTTEAQLGYATTRELLSEVSARIELSGNLDYRTADEG